MPDHRSTVHVPIFRAAPLLQLQEMFPLSWRWYRFRSQGGVAFWFLASRFLMYSRASSFQSTLWFTCRFSSPWWSRNFWALRHNFDFELLAESFSSWRVWYSFSEHWFLCISCASPAWVSLLNLRCYSFNKMNIGSTERVLPREFQNLGIFAWLVVFFLKVVTVVSKLQNVLLHLAHQIEKEGK